MSEAVEGARTFLVELLLPDATTAAIRCGAGEHLWDAESHQGVALPSTCLQGWCLTCAGRVLSGDWDQSDSLRYYPEDREAGFILLCTARPRGPLRVRTHQKQAMQAHREAAGRPTPHG